MNWLWERKIKEEEVKKILKNPSHPKFLDYSSLLLSRTNEPSIVFKKYLKPEIFYKNWRRIKKYMRKNKWNYTRIIFWDAIYEKIREKFKEKGIILKMEKEEVDPCLKKIGETIKKMRKEKKFTQKQIAERLGVSQQFFSRIESGKENITLKYLVKIVSLLGEELKISIGNNNLTLSQG